MAKLDDRNGSNIDREGTRLEIALDEYELSELELQQRQTAIFDVLRKGGFIPDQLIELVEDCEVETPVQALVYKAQGPFGLRFDVRVLSDDKERAEAGLRLLNIIFSDARRTKRDRTEGVMSASEAMAFFLRLRLRELKLAERDLAAAPVRTLKLLPRSAIAEIAMELLESCSIWKKAPSPSLNNLVRELLNLEGVRHGMPRNVEAKYHAAIILALAPTVRTRKLAKALHVNASSISRWRSDAEFKQTIHSYHEAFICNAQLRETMRKGFAGATLSKLLLSVSRQFTARKP